MSEVETNTIKAGYRIHVTTWENDADNYRTESMDGLTEGNVKFIVELCKLFYSHHNRNGQSETFGNYYDDYPDGLDEAIDEIIARFSDEDRTFDFGWGVNVVNSNEYVNDSLLWKLGINGSGEFCTRVFDEAVIEFIPEDIVIQVVTDRFI